MPYILRKAPKRDLYWVVSQETGKKHSKDPIPRAKAEAQMRVLVSAMKGEGDCGCGKGKDCKTKAEDDDALYLARSYAKAFPSNKRRGKGLDKHMDAWMRKELAKMDCGCGCGGRKKLRELSGGKLNPCPPGYEEKGLLCVEPCQDGERDDGTACWGDLKTHCHGDPSKPVWQEGHQECHTNDGLLHRYKKMIGRVDWAGTAKEVEDGMKEAFSADGPLAKAFDPEKNGVGAAFRKFGKDSNAAFAEVGDKLLKAFDPNQNGVKEAFDKVGEAMKNTIGNENWWKETMSNPDTYIMLIGMIATAAATVLSAGTLGPAAFIALQALGPALKIIGDAAQGRPVDGLDIAMLAISLVPLPGAGAGAKAASDAIIKGAAFGTKAAKALPYIQRAAQIGKVVVKGTQLAQSMRLVPSTCLANCPPPEVGEELGSECQQKKQRYALGYEDVVWTENCRKPECEAEDYNADEDRCGPASETQGIDADIDLGESMGEFVTKKTCEGEPLSKEEKAELGMFPRIYEKEAKGESTDAWFFHDTAETGDKQYKLYTECECDRLNSGEDKDEEWKPLGEWDYQSYGICGKFSKEFSRPYGETISEQQADEAKVKEAVQADLLAERAKREAERAEKVTQEEEEREVSNAAYYEQYEAERAKQEAEDAAAAALAAEHQNRMEEQNQATRQRMAEGDEARRRGVAGFAADVAEYNAMYGGSSGYEKNRGRGQMTELEYTQRPRAGHVRALQRRRAMTQTVKILPAQHRPVLLREVPVANSIGVSATGGDNPRLTNPGWYYPSDSNFEARAETQGFAGLGRYSAAF